MCTPLGVCCFSMSIPKTARIIQTVCMLLLLTKPMKSSATISYRSNGVLAAVSDKGVYGFRDSEEVWSYHLTNVVDYVSFQQKDRVVLTLGDALPGEEGKEEGTICWALALTERKKLLMSAEKTHISECLERRYCGGNCPHLYRHSPYRTGSLDLSGNTGCDRRVPMESFSRVLVVGQDMARILDMDKYTGKLPDVPEDVVETTPEVQTDEPLPTEGETNTDATQQDAGAEGTEGQEKTSGTEGETDASGAQKTETPKTEAATDTEKTETTQPAENTELGDVPAES